MKKIVVIEDNPLVQHLIRSWLSSDKFEVIVLTGIEGIVQKMNGWKPDLIVTDILVANATANDVITIFQKIPYPKIVISAMDQDDISFFAEKIGAIHSFRKPLKMDDFFFYINEFLKNI